MSLDEYLQAVSRYKLKDENVMQDEFVEALRVFDRQDVGQLSVAELRQALKSHGEVLTDEDLDEIISLANVKEDGTFDYMGKLMCNFVHSCSVYLGCIFTQYALFSHASVCI